MDRETLSDGLVNIIRGITRPFLSVFGTISWVCLFANGYEIPAYFTVLVYGMDVWWFGDRTFFKKR